MSEMKLKQNELNGSAPQTVAPDLVINRLFHAPRAKVFEAWINPELLKRWWSPYGFSLPVAQVDARPGGEFYIEMVSPDGGVYPGWGRYQEVTPPERLVLAEGAFKDEAGNYLLETLSTVTFEEQGDQTRLTLRVQVLKAAPEVAGALAGMEPGWNQTLNKLAILADYELSRNRTMKTEIIAEPGKQEVTVRRVFNAPAALVFKAYTDPKLIPQWWGPAYLTTTIDRLEARPGGGWRFIQTAPDGDEHGFHGVYHEVKPGERIVGTFEYEGMPGHISLDTATFEEQDGQTTLTEQSVFQSQEDRDGMMYSGMETGAAESTYRLADVLTKMMHDGTMVS